jgi:hypothetical protein
MLELKLMCNIIGVFISIVLLIYIAKLERTKCECSINWKRTYIKVFATITIIMSVLMCVRSMLYGKLKVTNNIAFFIYTLLFFYAIGALVNIFAMFTYSQDLILNKQCACSKDWTRTFMYYYSMVIGVFYFIIILSSILLSIMVKTNPNYLKKIKSRF